jgi:tetratricopeptide (TPR) repeat protein
LKTADDYYNYAVTLINSRRLQEAAEHLEKALAMAPRADHIHYALAAALALLGNAQAAYERLKTAIDLEPRNRYLARSDSDFAGILDYAPLASLLQLERGDAARMS